MMRWFYYLTKQMLQMSKPVELERGCSEAYRVNIGDYIEGR